MINSRARPGKGMTVSNDDLWNQWVEPYDLFISYARADDRAEPHMVSALVEHIQAAFGDGGAFDGGQAVSQPLKVFFDTKSIDDMKDWRDDIKKGLRQSKIMVAVLSAAYFQSKWCRLEWQEYMQIERNRIYPGEALSPIFIIAPRELERTIPDSARDWWKDVTSRNAVVELYPYWPRGLEGFREEVVQKRFKLLTNNVRRRVEHGRVLAQVPRNLAGRNPNFVGRHEELKALRAALSRFEMVGLCAVNGVGGIGKSSMAREYAYLYRREYLGGQFEIDLSTVKTIAGLQSQLVVIARDYLKVNIDPELPEAEQYRQARSAFDGLPPNMPALLILDNLNEDATDIVGRSNLQALPSTEKLHLLITTRADPRSLGGMEAFSLDVLSTGDALDLLFRYRQFARPTDDPDYLEARKGQYPLAEFQDIPADQEWKAALTIVNRLGRHALAVALVGAFLGTYPDVSYAQFARDMATDGIGKALKFVGGDKMVRNLIEHPIKLIGDLFEQSVAQLSPLVLRTLEYAAFLPPDLAPLAWLKELVTQDAQVAADLQPVSCRPPPWKETVRALAGLQYLVGSPYARMHRVVQEVVRSRLDGDIRAQRERRVLRFVRDRAGEVSKDTGVDPIEIAAVELMVRARAHTGDQQVAQTALRIVEPLKNLGRLQSAHLLATIAEHILTSIANTDPDSVEKQQDLAAIFDELGEVTIRMGDLPGAGAYLQQGLKISQKLFDADPASPEKQRQVSISLERLGDLSLEAGDRAEACDYFARRLQIARTLAEAEPESAESQRDLAVSFHKLGRATLSAGDVAAARQCYEQEHEISRKLAEDEPASAEKQRDLSIAYQGLGDASMMARDLAAALDCFKKAHEISRKLAGDDPTSAQKQRDLAVGLNKLGDLSVEIDDLFAAKSYFEQGLEIRRKLVEADPTSARKLNDLGRSHLSLKKLFQRRGDDLAANEHLRQFVAAWGQLDSQGRLPHPGDQAALRNGRQQLAECDG